MSATEYIAVTPEVEAELAAYRAACDAHWQAVAELERAPVRVSLSAELTPAQLRTLMSAIGRSKLPDAIADALIDQLDRQRLAAITRERPANTLSFEAHVELLRRQGRRVVVVPGRSSYSVDGVNYWRP